MSASVARTARRAGIQADVAAARTRLAERRLKNENAEAARRRARRSGTILTSPAGLIDEDEEAPQTILGHGSKHE